LGEAPFELHQADVNPEDDIMADFLAEKQPQNQNKRDTLLWECRCSSPPQKCKNFKAQGCKAAKLRSFTFQIFAAKDQFACPHPCCSISLVAMRRVRPTAKAESQTICSTDLSTHKFTYRSTSRY